MDDREKLIELQSNDMAEIKFTDLTSCPFCGHDKFYTTEYAYGTTRYAERFDGEEADNSELYDYLNTKNHNGRCYCRSCNKYLGNKETNIISSGARKILKQCKNKINT